MPISPESIQLLCLDLSQIIQIFSNEKKKFLIYSVSKVLDLPRGSATVLFLIHI